MTQNKPVPFVGRVIYAFQADLQGELALDVGELVLVVRVEDRYWFYGQKASSWGRFPTSHVTAVPLPGASHGQTYFATVADFAQLESGELSFSRGEILVGLRVIDSSWWYGCSGDGRKGIFPTYLVWQLDVSQVQMQGHGGRLARKRARAIQDLVAQLPEELDLKKGSELIVTELLEDGWYRGELDGKIGIFPSAFVTLIGDVTTDDSADSTGNKTWRDGACQVRIDRQASRCDDVHASSAARDQYSAGRSYGVVCYDYQAQYSDELSLCEGQIVYLVKRVNSEWIQGEIAGRVGIFPASFINVIVDCADCTDEPPEPPKRSSHQSRCSENVFVFPAAAKGAHHKSPSAGTAHQSIEAVMEYNLKQLSLLNPNQTARKPVANGNNTRPDLTRPPVIPPRRACQAQNAIANCAEALSNFSPQNNEHGADCRPSTAAADDDDTTTPVWRPSSDDSHAAENRRSYTRPAPPPPPPPPPQSPFGHAINQEMFRRHSSSSLTEQAVHLPTRPAPQVPASYDCAERARYRADQEGAHQMDQDPLRRLENRKKIEEQRQNVISELLVTEREYNRDLQITSQVFRLDNPKYLEDNGIDSAVLFGNILEIIQLSDKLLEKLNQCSDDKAADGNSIGCCFITLEPEFRRVYSNYCTNHDEAQASLEKYQNNAGTNQFLEQGVLSLRQRIICFNMGSIIIKPVQRIMKYPLILSELAKYTDDGLSDKKDLLQSSLLMTNVASYINESKRKKEIVLKYRDNEEKLSQRMSKLNFHSVAKKSSRLGMLLKTSLGITSVTRDSAFDEVEARFTELLRVLQTVQRDISTVCEHFKATSHAQFSISEAVASFYSDRSRNPLIDNFRTAQRMIYAQHWTVFDAYVTQHVRNPLAVLTEACQGPERLVQKRGDKLLDYDIATERLAKNKDPSMKRILEEEQNLARNTYLALNSQLLEELPTVTQHGYNIYRRCLSSFLYARKLFVGRTTKELLDLSEIPEIANLREDILADFNRAHSETVEHLSSVGFVSKTFTATGNRRTERSISPRPASTPGADRGTGLATDGLVVQSREALNMLRTKYSSDQLFMVNCQCDIKQVLDLAAKIGLIVGVIKKEDPMGNVDRWFVDAGEMRGFVPAKNLIPMRETNGSTSSQHFDSASSETSSVASHCGSFTMESNKEVFLSQEPVLDDQPPSYEQVRATPSPLYNPSGHLYCEIDDIVKRSQPYSQEETERIGQVPSPVYAELDHVALLRKDMLADSNMYKVQFNFRRRSPLELDLCLGELVVVISRKDEAGNSEWWLVENSSGIRGYAPSAYLSRPNV